MWGRVPRAKWLDACRTNRAMESLVPGRAKRGLVRSARILLWKAGRESRVGMLGRDGLSNKQ